MGVEDNTNIATKIFDFAGDTVVSIISSIRHVLADSNKTISDDEAISNKTTPDDEAMAKVLAGEAYTLDPKRDPMCQLSMLSDGQTPNKDDCLKNPIKGEGEVKNKFNNANMGKEVTFDDVLTQKPSVEDKSLLQNGL